MQERNVLILVVVLVVATAGAGVAVNALRNNGTTTFRAFYLTLDVSGAAVVGTALPIAVSVEQAFIDSRTLPSLFLSLDVGSFAVQSATPGTNPWHTATVWNLTGLDLTAARVYNITAVPAAAGPATLYAMIWVPLGDLRSVSVDASGHVNPADIRLMATESAALTVTAAG